MDAGVLTAVSFPTFENIPGRIRCQAKFLTCGISDFTPCMHGRRQRGASGSCPPIWTLCPPISCLAPE